MKFHLLAVIGLALTPLIPFSFLFCLHESPGDAPAGLQWISSEDDELLLINHADLVVTGSGLKIGSYVGQRAWIFECGNQALEFSTTRAAINAVRACGEEWIAHRSDSDAR